jgi:hypothetical protein
MPSRDAIETAGKCEMACILALGGDWKRASEVTAAVGAEFTSRMVRRALISISGRRYADMRINPQSKIAEFRSRRVQ